MRTLLSVPFFSSAAYTLYVAVVIGASAAENYKAKDKEEFSYDVKTLAIGLIVGALFLAIGFWIKGN